MEYIYIYIYIYMYVCMYVCMYVWMYLVYSLNLQWIFENVWSDRVNSSRKMTGNSCCVLCKLRRNDQSRRNIL